VEHLSTFGLQRDPFANEPRHSPWFASSSHEEAERRLLRGIQQGRGLCVLCGAGGSGKTMLVRHLLESLEEEVYEACMLVPVPGVSDARWVLDRFARQLGVEDPAVDGAGLLGQVYEQLAIVREDGRHTVLLIDEAQVLADHGVLAELRALLNLEYEDRRLLTLVLVGLPGLDGALAEDPALADRVEVRVVLPAFDPMTAASYLVHRLEAAGGSAAALDSSAVDALVKASGGNPRRLNVLGDNALFEAHLADRDRVSGRDVEKAAAELGLEPAVGLSTAASPVSPVPAGAGESGLAEAPSPASVEPHPAPVVESAAGAPAPGPAADPAPAPDGPAPAPSLGAPPGPEGAAAAPAPDLAPSGDEATGATSGSDEALDDLFSGDGAPSAEPPELQIDSGDAPELLMEDVIAADTDPPWPMDECPGDPNAVEPPADASSPAASPAAGAPARAPAEPAPTPAPEQPRERASRVATDESGEGDGEIEALFADLVDE
jgi:type II secretory pathway predicted ATPase ExeA